MNLNRIAAANPLPPGVISALKDFPGGLPFEHPTVSILVPLYNEQKHIVQLTLEILAQDYESLKEIFFIDGLSTDGTWETLQQLQAQDVRIRLLRNPQRVQSAALNLGASKASADVLLRLDAHAQYAPDVVRKSIEHLMATGAAGVGPIARPVRGDSPLSQSIAAALESKLGAGPASFRSASTSAWVDTIWNGCYWTHILKKVGSWREDYARIEDNDFNYRIRALGYGLYCSADIRALYCPRQSLPELWRQYAANGAGIVQALFSNWRIISPRHLAPLAFVSTLLLLAITACFWLPAGLAAAAIVSLYIAGILIFSLMTFLRRPGFYALLLPVVFITLHLGYGFGSLMELCKSLGKRMVAKNRAVDVS